LIHVKGYGFVFGLHAIAFEVLFTHKFKEARPAAVQVAHVQQARMITQDQSVQHLLALKQHR
jgi:hypothetical protein